MDTQHVFRQKRRGSRGPAVTKAVAQALIAESTVIPVNILNPLRHRLVDPAAVLQPIDVKVLPESSGLV